MGYQDDCESWRDPHAWRMKNDPEYAAIFQEEVPVASGIEETARQAALANVRPAPDPGSPALPAGLITFEQTEGMLKGAVRAIREKFAALEARVAKLEEIVNRKADASKVVEIQQSLECKLAATNINARRPYYE